MSNTSMYLFTYAFSSTIVILTLLLPITVFLAMGIFSLLSREEVKCNANKIEFNSLEEIIASYKANDSKLVDRDNTLDSNAGNRVF